MPERPESLPECIRTSTTRATPRMTCRPERIWASRWVDIAGQCTSDARPRRRALPHLDGARRPLAEAADHRPRQLRGPLGGEADEEPARGLGVAGEQAVGL